MQTVDLRELIHDEIGLKDNAWIIKSQEIDTPLEEVLQGVIDGGLPFIQAMGHLVTNGVFTHDQLMFIGGVIESTTQKNDLSDKHMDEYISQYQYCQLVNEERLDRKAVRPRDQNTIIGEYTSSALLHFAFAAVIEVVLFKEARCMDSSLHIMIRKHEEDARMFLKMALFHFNRNYQKEAKDLVKVLQEKIKGELKPLESDTYDILINTKPITV